MDDRPILNYFLRLNMLRYKDLTVWDPFRDVKISTVVHNYPEYDLYIGLDRHIWRKAK